MVDDTRKLLTDLFHGGDPNRLCFGSNATDALNLVISGLLEAGDHVITTNLEHNSVLRPLHHLQLFQGVEVDHVPCDADGFVDPDEFRRRFRKNTRLVVVTHASNVIGTIQPIREIGAHCREAGIPFVVDASQIGGRGAHRHRGAERRHRRVHGPQGPDGADGHRRPVRPGGQSRSS